jgi:hypothetical protein
MALLKPLLVAALLFASSCGGSDEADELPDTVVPFTTTASTASTAPSTTLSADPCVATVQQLDGGEDLPAEVDLLDLAAHNELAPLPIPGAENAVISDQGAYNTRDEYIASVTLDDPAQRDEDLATAGFKRGTDTRLQFGHDFYGVIVMELGSPEQAQAYRNAHLTQVCARAVGMRPMQHVDGGAAFYRSDTRAARAVVVMGRYEVNLDICTCVEVADRLALAEKWASAMVLAAERSA